MPQDLPKVVSSAETSVVARVPRQGDADAGKQQHPGSDSDIETSLTVDLVGRGGFGYLLKDRVLETGDFLAAAQRVADGGSALDPHVVSALLNRSVGLDQLTDREQEVIGLMAQGLTNTGIARRLVLSERTVEAHVRRLLLKLDLDDSEDANRRVLAVLHYLGVRAA